MNIKILSFALIIFIVGGCSTPVKEPVVTYDAVGVVKGSRELSREELSAYAEYDHDEMSVLIGPGGVLIAMMVDQATGGWLSSNLDRPTLPGPTYRYAVVTQSGQEIQVDSSWPSFKEGDCVFVRIVDGEWKMGTAYTCGDA